MKKPINHQKTDPKNAENTPGADAKITELTNDLQRIRADFENFRKQTDLQKDQAIKSARLATVAKLLPLLDDLDRAFSTYPELAPLEKSLEKTLKDLDLIKIPSDEKTEFNPDLHDAIAAEGDGEKELISATLRPGYYYGSEVLRPALVKVQRV